jgi:hypothetical protein
MPIFRSLTRPKAGPVSNPSSPAPAAVPAENFRKSRRVIPFAIVPPLLWSESFNWKMDRRKLGKKNIYPRFFSVSIEKNYLLIHFITFLYNLLLKIFIKNFHLLEMIQDFESSTLTNFLQVDIQNSTRVMEFERSFGPLDERQVRLFQA